MKPMSKKDIIFTEPEVEVTSSLDEVQADVALPKQGQVPDQREVEPKVDCLECRKKMSAKTLKYSHGPNCMIKKQKQRQEDEEYANLSHVAKQLAEEVRGVAGANTLHAVGMLDSLNSIPDHAIKQLIQTHTRAARAGQS